MNTEDAVEEAKSIFWGAVGECDCDNESARKGMDYVSEFIGHLLDEHAKTAAILHKILAESGSYLQTKTREEANARIAIVGKCACLPNLKNQGADK
jgi:hypothetical protein